MYPNGETVPFQTNAVFRIDEARERSLWTIVEANSGEHVAEYIYVVEGERLSRVRVVVEPFGPKNCRVRVRYVHTAILEKGVHFLSGVTDESFQQKMQSWQSRISAGLRQRVAGSAKGADH